MNVKLKNEFSCITLFLGNRCGYFVACVVGIVIVLLNYIWYYYSGMPEYLEGGTEQWPDVGRPLSVGGIHYLYHQEVWGCGF